MNIYYFLSLIMIIIGLSMRIYKPKYPPENVGVFCHGYKSNGALKTKESWNYTQKISGNTFAAMGVVIGVWLIVLDVMKAGDNADVAVINTVTNISVWVLFLIAFVIVELLIKRFNSKLD